MFSYMKQRPGFYKEVVALATPIVLQNLITSALGMADTFMVGMLGRPPWRRWPWPTFRSM